MKKVISLLLLLTVALAPMTSCNSKSQDTDSDVQQTTADGTTEVAETTTERLTADVPVKDYGGYEFRILGNSPEWSAHWYSRDIDVEGENGETLNDAIYLRNTSIEDRYNIKITGVYSKNLLGDARKNISAGTDLYDVMSIQMQDTTAVLAQEGLLHDLKQVPYIDLEKPWWDQKANAQLSVGNKLFFTISDLLVIDKDALFIFLFNKDMIQDFQLENPYQLVRDGKWTIDKFYEMAKQVTSDSDGDGEMTDMDTYGFLSATHTMHSNIAATGNFLITKDSQDLPAINMLSDGFKKAFDKWIEIHNDRHNTIVAQDYANKYPGDLIWDQQLDMLAEKRGLFLFTGMNRVTMLRSMNVNFGILPNPKIDETQKEYYNTVHAWCTTAISIPISVADVERTGIILEALTAESYYTLRPAYYDVSLKSKLMRDEESGEMLDLIFRTRCYDQGQVYNWGNVFALCGDLALKKSTDFTSAAEKIYPKVELAMNQTIEKFAAMEKEN